MSLEQILNNAVGHLRSGRLNKEEQVKFAIISPVLRALGWNDADPDVCVPEYSVEGGSVDYALLDRDQALVFIEAKRVDAMDGRGEEQLFRYASNQGVPFLVLTDGNRWDFYLSMAPGLPTERRFYRLELRQFEHRISEYVDFLEKHLRKDRIVSGQARKDAEERHASNRERERACEAIPGAWRTLLEEPDEMLRDLLAEKVETVCGTKPELDDVEAFLEERLRTLEPTPEPRLPSDPKPPVVGPRSEIVGSVYIVGFIYREEEVETGSAIATLEEILNRFDRENPEFMDRFASATNNIKRNMISRNPDELYHGSRSKSKGSKDLGNGWWLRKGENTEQTRKYIETACHVAGVKYGDQLRLIER